MSLAALTTTRNDVGPTARLRAMLTPEFVRLVGWEPQRGSLELQPGPAFGNHRCPSRSCGRIVASGSPVKPCEMCIQRARERGVSIEEIVESGPGSRYVQPAKPCQVAECGRLRYKRTLCQVHEDRRVKTGLDLESYLATGPQPVDSFGKCGVEPCLRGAAHRHGLCIAHTQQRTQARKSPDFDEARWLAEQQPRDWDTVISVRGLSELVTIELLCALQHRIASGVAVKPVVLRKVVGWLREGGYRDLSELPVPAGANAEHRALIRGLRDSLGLLTATPDTERDKDQWDLRVFGYRGSLDFTVVTQTWLRDGIKHWAAEVMPTMRARTLVVVREVLYGCRRLSESLETRPDRGLVPSALGRRDALAFLNRLGHLERTNQISTMMRIDWVRGVRRLLADCRDFGLTRAGLPFHGLAADFAIQRDDVPQEPDTREVPRDLPLAVMRTLTENLDLLAARSGHDVRRLTELLMDTGRRPDEICGLRFECLATGEDNKWVLIWNNWKGNRHDRRLPINNNTAEIIQAQQANVAARFPDTPRDQLPLFPRPHNNRAGTYPLADAQYSAAHRQWVRQIPALFEVIDSLDNGSTATRKVSFVDDAGHPFNPALIRPYAYRHTYCQRHADQGTPPDLLRELLDHQSMATTQGYYRVREKRLRAAVDRVYARQVTGDGQRIWPEAITSVDDAARARMRIGEVAVPYGVCTEPSNVKAAGAACPYKFTCIACGHFRSDPSYLPELRAYHDRLLETRQRVRAATDLQDWAKDKADPADAEITAVADLAAKLEADTTRLTDEDRALLDTAVQMVRSARRTVSLGMPGHRPSTETRTVRVR
ncbi:MAG: site-specific integrase [Pseudonocardiales bacterium]|nr:site-specific integrase [Pseudonocardiales bacterium]